MQSTEGLSESGRGNTRDLIEAPAIALPKGGGALHGIGEKFAANPVTGTGSMTIPIATSQGRSGFGPQLSLSYDSGAGNGPFGLGWNLALSAISRNTAKGLPRYADTAESDVFILSGAEDLVAVLVEQDGKWVPEVLPECRLGEQTYAVKRYRPRIEGLFARIERWTDILSRQTHWRAISRDNITTLYGAAADSTIADPSDPSRIFSWLICESWDDKGNAIVYEYTKENSQGIDPSWVHEKNRSDAGRSANRYLKRIKYGNQVSRQVQTDLSQANWLFEVVFDYGEEHYQEHGLGAGQRQSVSVSASEQGSSWPARPDPFSTYRPGFEVRTYRRCRRVMMFHKFIELGSGPTLVRSTEFHYDDFGYAPSATVEAEMAHQGSTRIASIMRSVVQAGYVRDQAQAATTRHGASYLVYFKKELPPVQFDYSRATIQDDVHEVDGESIDNLPTGIDHARYQWVDLDGEGLAGILTEQGGAWFYKRNLSALPLADADGKPQYRARFATIEPLARMPAGANLAGSQQLLDLAGDGQLDVVEFEGPAPGFFERTLDGDWERFKSFAWLPNLAWGDPNMRFVDLSGDGHADIIVTEDDAITWYPSLAEDGFGPGRKVRQAFDEETGPRLVFADATQSIYLSDMSGDGLTDLVRIRNGEVCYWPNLGYGRFGAKVAMDGAPWFDAPDRFDQARIRLADIDGSGATDILYLGSAGVDLYFNRGGNSWTTVRKLGSFPPVDNHASVMAADLFGNGTACLVWSSPLPGHARRALRYMDLMGGQKPHLLIRSRNNLGAETEIAYAPSTRFYLADKLAGKPWITRLPFPVHCVEQVVVTDKWRKTRYSTRYSYHHGYFDGVEREFRGFGRVEQVDVEDYGIFAKGNVGSPYVTQDKTLYQPPVKTISWYHTGAQLERQGILNQFAGEYFPARFPLQQGFHEKVLPEPELDGDLSGDEWREALRACKGMSLRQEVYELDADALAAKDGAQVPVRLFSVATHNCHVRRLQPKQDNRHAVFLVMESETLSYHYELDLRPVILAPDPRIAHTLNLSTDAYGNVQQSVSVAYPRVAPASPVAAILADLPVAYYRLHEAAGASSATDASGHANHGVYSAAGVTPGVAGLDAGVTAVQFDGLGNGRIVVPDHPTLNPDHLTIEARISWAGPNGEQQRLLEKSFGAAADWRTNYSLSILIDGRVHAEVATDTGDYRADSVTAVALGTATHVAMTYDGSTLALYINGVLDGSSPASGAILDTFGASLLGIGNQVERTRQFKGVMDEVALFDRALAVERIRAHVALPRFPERDLAAHLPLIDSVQHERHVAYTETHFTNDVMDAVTATAPVRYHRLRQTCELQTYEVTGIVPQAGAFYFDLDKLRQWDFSLRYPSAPPSSPLARKAYHDLPSDLRPSMRLVDHARTLFFNDDAGNPADFLNQPFALGTQGQLGLRYEHYKLALTDALLDAIFIDGRLDLAMVAADPASSPRHAMRSGNTSGYLSGALAVARFGLPAAGEYWLQSGSAGFAPDAAQHFYLPEKYTDSFGNQTLLDHDVQYDLFVQSTTDALGNLTQITDFDYRVLAPRAMKDANDNLTVAVFDVLGMVSAVAIKGKGNEGDSLDAFDDALANPSLAERAAFFGNASYDEAQARTWLGKATLRHVYWFGETPGANGSLIWGEHHARACAITREQHVAQLDAQTAELSRLQVAFECSDGLGAVLSKKVQAEPAPGSSELRWIASGKTVLNNKGKPVKQYAPYFSHSGHLCEEPVEEGVTPLMYYDAVGRLIRTEMPDGTFSRAVFSPWHVSAFDANDTVLESRWYAERGAPDPSLPLPLDLSGRLAVTPDFRAAWLAARHANTPPLTVLDSLGRSAIGIAHNRVEDAQGSHDFGGKRYRDERYLTFTRFDAQGKPLWIRDARGNLVMQYITPVRANNASGDGMPPGAVPCYDMTGNLLFQHSMDAGDRWTLNDAAGKPLFAWDSRDNLLSSSYDKLHRPTTQELKNPAHPDRIVVSLIQYGEGTAAGQAGNLRGRPYRSFDQSGVVTSHAFDFKGNVLTVRRRLAADHGQDTDWRGVLALALDQEPDALLMPAAETFTRITEFDALNRMTLQYNWHRSGKPVAVYQPSYNARGILARETLIVGATKEAAGHSGGKLTTVIDAITHDAKGQRLRLALGNGVITAYSYDADTFRLLTLVSTRPNKPELQRLGHTYDACGNITEIFDDAIPTEFFNGAVIEPRQRYAYDALYQLTEATGREHAGQLNFGAIDNWNDCPYRVDYGAANAKAWRNYLQRYLYDSVGNMLTMQHSALGDSSKSWTRQYQYAIDSNRLLSTGMGAPPVDRYAASPTLDYRYSYTAHGSMAGLPHLPAMDWDFTEQLQHISRAPASQGTQPDACPDSSLEAWYRYDASKQRTRKRVVKQGGLVEERFYLGGLEWYRRMLNGVLIEEIETLHVFDGQQRLLVVEQVLQSSRSELPARPLYRYTLSNYVASATVETDENADVISYEEFHPYGTTAYQSGPKAAEVKLKRYRYTGMERDEESGLSYHGARYYAPSMARWSACDPSLLVDGLNQYAYGRANPVGLQDLNGKQSAQPGAWDNVKDRGLALAGGVYGAGKSLLGGFAAAFKLGYYAMGSNMYFFTGDKIYEEQDIAARQGYHALGKLADTDIGDIAQGYVTARGKAVTEAADRGDIFGASEAAGETLMDLFLLADSARSSTPTPKIEFDMALAFEGGITSSGAISISLLGPTNLAQGAYVMAAMTDKVKQPGGEHEGREKVKQAYLKDQGVSKVGDLDSKSYWNLMEKIGVDALMKELGVIAYEQIHLFEVTVQKGRSVMNELGRIPDALFVDPSNGKMMVSEFTAMKDIPAGSAKYKQIAKQMSAFERVRAGTSTLWARMPNGGFLDVSDAVQTLGTYPHWDPGSIGKFRACF